MNCLEQVIEDLSKLSSEAKVSSPEAELILSGVYQHLQACLQELRVAVAVLRYQRGEISQSKAAELAGMSRTNFIEALTYYRVPVCQYTPEELTEELALASCG